MMPTPTPTIGSLFVIAAPSGAGKSSMVAELLRNDAQIQLSVSYTTRAPRTGEVNGVAYHFTDVADFLSKQAAGEFIESARVHDNYYGTSKTWITQALACGKDVLLEIDWQGAQQVRAHFPEMVGVFILPPSMDTLKERLIKRGTDSDEVISRRLIAANDEMRHAGEFEYVIINTVFSDALAQLQSIVQATRLRFANQSARAPEIFNQLGIPTNHPQ